VSVTSRGIGDVGRALGQPQAWIDQHFRRQEPSLPDANGDKLIEFMNYNISKWESQVATEAREYHNGQHGAAILRWAHDIRRQCAAIRLVLANYAKGRDQGALHEAQLRQQIRELATAWNNDPDWRHDWD
jgi:hypothetical protein